MPSLQQLLERDKKVKQAQRKLQAQIRRAKTREMTTRFMAFGQEMTTFFNNDPTCSNSKQIADLCLRYLIENSNDCTTSPEGSKDPTNVSDE